MGLTPSGGNPEPAAPQVPEWTLSTDDGKVHRLRDLNTLQKWIVERKVGRNERISRAGGPWLALEDVVELTPFFNVVDEADRARASTGLPGGMPTAPRFPSSSGSWAVAPAPPAIPAIRTPSGPMSGLQAPPRVGATPPPVPFDARRPISEDGPTVPNRRLPGLPPEASAGGNGAGSPAPAAAAAPLPWVRESQPGILGVGPSQAGGGRTSGSQTAVGNTAPSPPLGAVASAASPAIKNSAIATSTPVAGDLPAQPARQTGIVPTAAAAQAGAKEIKEGIRRPKAAVGAPSAPVRTALMFGPSITTETHPLEGGEFHSGRQGRNTLLVVGALLLAAVGGGYWWWTEQQGRGTSARSPVAVDSPAPRAPGIEPAGGTLPAPTAASANQASPRNASGGVVAPATANPGGTVAPPAPSAITPGGTEARMDALLDRVPEKPGSPRRGGPAGPSTQSYDHLVNEADRLLVRGKSTKADKVYAQALAIRPDGVAALTGAAYVLLDRQRHFKAIEMFRRALAVQPTFGPALFGIAESYRARGDSAQALGAYRQYLAIAPSGTDAPAARRQVKDLESASGSPPAGDPTDRPSGDRPSGKPSDDAPPPDQE